MSVFGVIMLKPDNITKRGSPVTHEEQVPPPSDSDHYKWKAPTNVTVVNYFSLDCPHCRELFMKENELLRLYDDDFSLVYRHSPLPLIQPLSLEKSIIAECVYRETDDHEFFLFIGDMFAKYKKEQTDNEWVYDIANTYVRDSALFETCLTGEGKRIVEKELERSLAHTVYGTPTIVVFVDGMQTARLNLPSARSVIRLYDSLRDMRVVNEQP